MTADTFRRLALDLDGAVEQAHMGHPDFRVNGRIFATLRAHDTLGMVALTPEEQAEVIHEHPTMFEPVSGAWGRQGCTNVLLEAAGVAPVRAALMLAWERKATMPAPRARTRAVPARGARTRGRRGA
jgi:hypothetical protein